MRKCNCHRVKPFASAESSSVIRSSMEIRDQLHLHGQLQEQGRISSAISLWIRKCVLIKGITTGKIVDYGVKDSMNMGACMAPAAAELIEANFKDLDVDKDYYDAIFTGDLGEIGNRILSELLKEKVLILLISCMIVECLYTKGKLSVQAEAAVAAVQLFLEAVLWTGL